MRKFLMTTLVLVMITIISSCQNSTQNQITLIHLAVEKVDPSFVVIDAGTEKMPGYGKHIVLIAGDEEYRSEESMPLLAKILSKHHGFKCTVLFSQGKDNVIDPMNQKNIPGTEALAKADLMMVFLRFRNLKEGQMKHIDDYLLSGKPVIGMRTSTHAFNGGGPYAHYSNGYNGPKKQWKGGFGRFVLGEKWINHHGAHGRQSTRGLIAKGAKDHDIVKGIKDGDIWGTTDVYGVRLPLPGDSKPIVMGQVLENMKFDGKPLAGGKNNPMMPVGWTKSYQIPNGKKGKVFNTTMGASQDLEKEGSRRMMVNAVYWCLGMKVPDKAKVDIVGKPKITKFGFGQGKAVKAKGIKPNDHQIKEDE